MANHENKRPHAVPAGAAGFSVTGAVMAMAAIALVAMGLFQYSGDSTRFQQSMNARSIDQSYEGLLRHQIYALVQSGIGANKIWPREWERLRPTEGPSFAMLPFSPLGVLQLLNRLTALPATSDTRRLLLGSLEERMHMIGRYMREYGCSTRCVEDTALPFPYGVHFAVKLENASGVYAGYHVFGIFSIRPFDLLVLGPTQTAQTAPSLDIRYTLVWFAAQATQNSGNQVHGTSFRFSLPVGGEE